MPSTTIATRCPECGRRNAPTQFACAACGTILRTSLPVGTPRPSSLPPPPPTYLRLQERRTLGLSSRWFFLVLGLALAPVFTFAPLLRYMGWFFGSLVHETGHAAVAWALGCPAIPAIRLDGHAAAVHGPQSTLLALVAWAALACLAWRARRNRAALALLATAALLYPAVAFTAAREPAFLLAGHVGEIAFATFFFQRALSGGFSGSDAERALHATMGWFLLGRNVWLSGGLLASPSVKAWYGASGSFGLTNDYLRVAREVFGCPVEAVGGLMLLPALAALPLALVLARER